MTDPLVCLSEADVRRHLPLGDLAGALASALIALADGSAVVPPRIGAGSPTGLLGAMPGYVPGLGLGAKLVSVYPSNPPEVAPSHQALIALFDESNGSPLAVMDAGYITAIRTAMVSAIAARALARHGGRRGPAVAVLGAGVQGAAHLDAFAHLLEPREVRVASRNQQTADALAARHPGARAVATFAEAVAGADAVCCCTDAPSAVVEADWVVPGMHVSSVGSGAELPPELLRDRAVFVESRVSALAPRPAGALELQGRPAESLVEIGEVLAGRAPGRESDDAVTVFKSVGNAAEDLAAARVVWDHLQGGVP